ncbi:glycosyltransferase family 2 protein [Abyssibius alkaniclasticus]|uniref:glycosyltransferase family 2 protein n=1 Tax=Abyssibius alkaniclasticus TaxID=2881234 RepID=UPI004059A4F7
MKNKSIAVITSVRGEDFFLEKWIAYYGAQFGRKNLYVVVDGHDQVLPEDIAEVNFITIPHVQLPVVAFDKRRARMISGLANGLFNVFDIIIATDVDEYIVLDPAVGCSLANYLSDRTGHACLSSLGVDLRHNTQIEPDLEMDKPVLGQRRFAKIEAKYTKPSIAFEALQWKSGLHRVHRKSFTIDPNLYLFHLGLVDQNYVERHLEARVQNYPDWRAHANRRRSLMAEVGATPTQDTDTAFAQAREMFRTRRRLIHRNKPKALRGNFVVEIPERFFGIL